MTPDNEAPRPGATDGPERPTGFWGEAFAWSDSAAPQVLPSVALFGLLSAAICAAAGPALAIPIGPHEVGGVVLGLFLVLRTNAGYERWSEARRLWGGIVNQSRNLAVQALSYDRDPRRRAEVVRWTIAFAHVARRQLRGERTIPEVAALLGEDHAARIARSAHMPTFVARRIGCLLRQGYDRGAIGGFAFAAAEAQRATLLDHVGGCERILKTPLARAYSIKIRRFIVLFLATLNFALLDKFEAIWLVPVFLMLIAYPVLSVDVIGSELQNPFSTRNLGHLPLDAICRTIESDLLGLLADEPGPAGPRPRPRARAGEWPRAGVYRTSPGIPREASPKGKEVSGALGKLSPRPLPKPVPRLRGRPRSGPGRGPISEVG